MSWRAVLLAVCRIHITAAGGFSVLRERQASGQTAYVNLASTDGPPEHIASGFIYGIPDNFPNQIPNHWYTDIGFKHGKGGGAQIGAVGSRGWVVGVNDYKGRFQSTLDNYKTCRAVGAEYHIYVHDLWGTDHTNRSSKWPGDGGDWADYTKFVQQLMADVAANMDPSHVTWDIWNEPDISVFWVRGVQQWVDMYIKTHKLIRANPALNAMKLSGPSLAYRPMANNTWWTTWLRQIAGNGTVPDYYSYHLEGTLTAVDNDPQYTNTSLAALLKQNNLPEQQVFVSEYAQQSEMVPGGYIWWISRLERYNFPGMLGNWLGGTQLHDLFGGLLTKRKDPKAYTATDYVASPGYPVYKYYNQNMTGVRVRTNGSTDRWFDAYATKGEDKVRILAGVKVKTGTWSLVVRGLDAVGYPPSGSLNVTTYSFEGSSISQIAALPTHRGTDAVTYSDNALTLMIRQTTQTTGWAFEVEVKPRNH